MFPPWFLRATSQADKLAYPFGDCRESWRFIYEVSAAILEQCGYHLGSAIDDNPLAVLSKSMFHCLRQYCGGSPRVSSEMCFQHIGNSFPAVQCLFYWQSFYFCPSLLSLSVPNIRVMLNCISAVAGGQLIFFKMIALFKFIFYGTYITVFSVNLLFKFILQKWLHFLSSFSKNDCIF